MNYFYIATKNLLTGQAGLCTGEAQDIVKSRDGCFTVYTSGGAPDKVVRLQYNSPFFADDWVDFFSFTGLSTGYAQPAYLTTPMQKIRAIGSGNGNFWVSFTAQN